MSDKINWGRIRTEFEKDITKKLEKLPGHREVSENLKEFRGIISHELPETVPKEIFQQLITILFKGETINVDEIRKKFLNPELSKERKILEKNKDEFEKLRASAGKWVSQNLSEKELQTLYKEHKTGLPRRYTIYENQNLPFQEIAIDTLARFKLIKDKS